MGTVPPSNFVQIQSLTLYLHRRCGMLLTFRREKDDSEEDERDGEGALEVLSGVDGHWTSPVRDLMRIVPTRFAGVKSDE